MSKIYHGFYLSTELLRGSVEQVVPEGEFPEAECGARQDAERYFDEYKARTRQTEGIARIKLMYGGQLGSNGKVDGGQWLYDLDVRTGAMKTNFELLHALEQPPLTESPVHQKGGASP